MTGDLLREAAAALRETSAGASRAEGDGFARVLHDVRRARRRQRSLSVVALGLALALTGFGAWAAVTGRLASVGRGAARASVSPRPSTKGTPAPTIVLLPATEAAPEPPSRGTERLPLARAAHARAGAARATPLASRGPDVTPDELYREAHEAHFVRGDCAAALALWDRYLALSPLPRLAVEARYNRAIALVRLGRRDEAARALRPFADGDYGSYRAADARALLDALAR